MYFEYIEQHIMFISCVRTCFSDLVSNLPYLTLRLKVDRTSWKLWQTSEAENIRYCHSEYLAKECSLQECCFKEALEHCNEQWTSAVPDLLLPEPDFARCVKQMRPELVLVPDITI